MQKPISGLIIGPLIDQLTLNISSRASNFAVNIVNNTGLKSPIFEGCPQNAIRHVVWQAIITRDLGEKTANRIGNAHENSFSDSNINRIDTEVDQRNNIIGRSIGLESKGLSNKDIVYKVLDYYRGEGLWVITFSNNNTPEIDQMKITEDQFISALFELMKLDENGKEKKE